MLQYRTMEIMEVKLTDEQFEDGFLIRIIPEGTNYYLYLFHEDYAAALDLVGIDIDTEEEVEAVTVGGWAMEVLGKIPEVGDCFEEYGIAVEVIEMDGRRVESVHVLDKRQDEGSDDEQEDENSGDQDEKQQSFFK